MHVTNMKFKFKNWTDLWNKLERLLLTLKSDLVFEISFQKLWGLMWGYCINTVFISFEVGRRYEMTLLKRNKSPFKTTRKTVADWSPIKTGYIWSARQINWFEDRIIQFPNRKITLHVVFKENSETVFPYHSTY